ncbi:MAG: hypothetical protein GW938_09975 [Leptospira sp.]|nr:hypothetical protein [Leptospira sp.]NCS94648.1 hypothetical protein [Leptospira sp.]
MKQEVIELAAERTSQMRVNPKLVEEAKIAFVKAFDKDYKNINNLGNEILQWFINSQKNAVADNAKKRSA